MLVMSTQLRTLFSLQWVPYALIQDTIYYDAILAYTHINIELQHIHNILENTKQGPC